MLPCGTQIAKATMSNEFNTPDYVSDSKIKLKLLQHMNNNIFCDDDHQVWFLIRQRRRKHNQCLFLNLFIAGWTIFTSVIRVHCPVILVLFENYFVVIIRFDMLTVEWFWYCFTIFSHLVIVNENLSCYQIFISYLGLPPLGFLHLLHVCCCFLSYIIVWLD